MLSKAPAKAVSRSTNAPPADEESRLSTVDVSTPEPSGVDLIFSNYALNQVEDFMSSVDNFDRLDSLGVASPNRLLVHGPPGTGKTTVARRIAAELRLPLVTSRSDALVSSLLGQTSRNIREVFDYAARTPCVLFLDEFDALAKNRSDSREVGELQRVVIALLENMDALDPSVVLLAATNHPQLLDPAVWRRFPHKIKTQLPGFEERKKLWRSRVGGVSLAERDADRLARASAGLSAAAVESAALDAARDAVLKNQESIEIVGAFRRLARFMRYEDYELFDGDENEIRFLRSWAPDVFTMRALAATFETSTRRVGTLIAGDTDARTAADSASTVRER